MSHDNSAASTEATLCASARNPNIRVLHRVRPLEDFPLAPRGEGPFRKVAIVDTETTGTDPQTDEIIDIAVVMLEVDAEGEIVGIMSAGQSLRDPGRPIPAHITRLTGISDDDVRGKTIDLDRLERRLAGANVLVAHNARFDIAFVEDLLPGVAGAAWACSANDFDWSSAGYDGAKLGHLLMQIGRFNDAHRAMSDVISLIHLLAHRLDGGRTVLGHLLATAEQPTIRFEAVGAPFSRRSLLKARGYRWDALRRVWWCEVGNDQCAAEERWFRENIVSCGPTPRMLPIDWHQRHR